MKTYNHNLTAKHNAAIDKAQAIAESTFHDAAANYAEAKAEAKQIRVDGYSMEILPAYSEMIEGKDYGSERPSVVNMGAMLVG